VPTGGWRLLLGPPLLLLAGCGWFGGDTASEASPSTETTAASQGVGTPGSTNSDSTSIEVERPVVAIDWQPCDGGFECGEVMVPVDHSQAGGTEIPLALIRRPATGERRGAIFVNPGGPGASGVEFVRNGFRLDAETGAAYDLIGFDPRGIGLSAGLACSPDRSEGPLPDFSPNDAEEAAGLDAGAQALAERCEATAGALLLYLDTASVARDLDLARAAVGDEQLHFFGFSFGTLIGQVYADLFPERVGHLVLDGVVDPTASLTELLTQQAAAFERSFLALDDACGVSLACPDGGVVATYDRVLDELERTGPIGQVGPAEFEYAALVTLYSEQLQVPYVDALAKAELGDLSGIEQLSDLFVGGIDFGAYAAVECTDSPRPVGLDAWDEFASELAAIAPRFGATVANELRTCALWPVEARPARDPVTAPGAAPILVIGTTNDPATPLVNAELVAANLERSALVVLEADRHTAYQASGCVQEIVQAYFLDDVLPETTTRCSD